mmetsp:Transcript_38389/g.110962  ORF Transcript_38389/g.110962 Transcript_38389/m.110962 type:complete len:212 (-) Transcript_38389:803-1438(-)
MSHVGLQHYLRHLLPHGRGRLLAQGAKEVHTAGLQKLEGEAAVHVLQDAPVIEAQRQGVPISHQEVVVHARVAHVVHRSGQQHGQGDVAGEVVDQVLRGQGVVHRLHDVGGVEGRVEGHVSPVAVLPRGQGAADHVGLQVQGLGEAQARERRVAEQRQGPLRAPLHGEEVEAPPVRELAQCAPNGRFGRGLHYAQLLQLRPSGQNPLASVV